MSETSEVLPVPPPPDPAGTLTASPVHRTTRVSSQTALLCWIIDQSSDLSVGIRYGSMILYKRPVFTDAFFR